MNMNSNITVNDIIDALPKPNCRTILQISLCGNEKAGDKMYDTTKRWVKMILDGELDIMDRQAVILGMPFYGGTNGKFSLYKEDDWKIENEKWSLRESHSHKHSTSRLVNLGLWKDTFKTVPAFSEGGIWTTVVPAPSAIRKAYKELTKIAA